MSERSAVSCKIIGYTHVTREPTVQHHHCQYSWFVPQSQDLSWIQHSSPHFQGIWQIHNLIWPHKGFISMGTGYLLLTKPDHRRSLWYISGLPVNCYACILAIPPSCWRHLNPLAANPSDSGHDGKLLMLASPTFACLHPSAAKDGQYWQIPTVAPSLLSGIPHPGCGATCWWH